MASKVPALERVLGPSALAAVAYGEVGSSIYFALGIVALYALGLTPSVLLVAGALFLLVSLSYAEGTAAIPRDGRRRHLRRAARSTTRSGFVTGWVLFLDYLIVIALAALFMPHYLGDAVGWEGITRPPVGRARRRAGDPRRGRDAAGPPRPALSRRRGRRRRRRSSRTFC